jgi:hypothetical protein
MFIARFTLERVNASKSAPLGAKSYRKSAAMSGLDCAALAGSPAAAYVSAPSVA